MLSVFGCRAYAGKSEEDMSTLRRQPFFIVINIGFVSKAIVFIVFGV